MQSAPGTMESNEQLRITKLKGVENWGTWKFQVRIILTASDVYDIVAGQRPAPEAITQGEAATVAARARKIREWMKEDSVAQRIIVTSVTEPVLLHIINCTSSKQMWDNLCAVYENKTDTSVHMLQRQWFSLVKDPTDDMATHVSKIQDICHRLKALGEDITDNMMMTKILMTLPSCYDHFATAWESTALDQRTLSNLTSRLIMEEARKNSQDNQVGALAAEGRGAVRGKKDAVKNKKNVCFKCGKNGHWKRNCKQSQGDSSKQSQGNSSKQGQSDSSKQVGALISTLFTSNNGEQNKDTWFLDSGATDHMSGDVQKFVNLQHFKSPVPVRVGNGNIINASGRGNVYVQAYDSEHWISKYLQDVLFVPDLKYNLFSMRAALDKGLRLEADNEECRFLKSNKMVAISERDGKLFKMKFREMASKENFVGISRSGNSRVSGGLLQEWHEKLAHQNFRQVRQILRDAGIETKGEDPYCEACVLGKAHRQPFPTSKTQTNEVGELVHADLCGAMEENSFGNSRYFLLFKDDFSQFRRLYFLQKKKQKLLAVLKIIYREL